VKHRKRDPPDHNQPVKMRIHSPGTIHCCICLNRGEWIAATTTVKGYSVCPEHVELVSRPNFDIFDLLPRKHGSHQV